MHIKLGMHENIQKSILIRIDFHTTNVLTKLGQHCIFGGWWERHRGRREWQKNFPRKVVKVSQNMGAEPVTCVSRRPLFNGSQICHILLQNLRDKQFHETVGPERDFHVFSSWRFSTRTFEPKSYKNVINILKQSRSLWELPRLSVTIKHGSNLKFTQHAYSLTQWSYSHVCDWRDPACPPFHDQFS